MENNTLPDEICPATKQRHKPDWLSLTVEHDGDGVYIDVNCKHCGRSGCLGSVKVLEEDISW